MPSNIALAPANDLLSMTRADIAAAIDARLARDEAALTESFRQSGPIGYFVVDDLLPADLAHALYTAFPPARDMILKRTLREEKYIAAQMNRYAPLLEEALFAFQEPSVIARVQKITGLPGLQNDPQLYAGGISRMEKNGFLNPHIDNSHNKERTHWRSLNLLYYVSPDWRPYFGGNLEVWPHGPKDAGLTLPSLFNRLIVMATHQHSWHSVSPIRAEQARCCISNYYFSDTPVHPEQQFHVTSFRGRPEQPLTDLALQADAKLRGLLRKLKKSGVFDTGHYYQKNK